MTERVISEDIVRLGPDVLEELRAVFRFERGICWHSSIFDTPFPDIKISSRQRERAVEAIDGGRPFWDLVSSTVFLPFPTNSKKDGESGGAFVLCGVERTVGPDEPERWLALLSSWVWNRLQTLKMEHCFAEEGIPAYVAKLVSTSHGCVPSHVLSLGFRHCITPSLYKRVFQVSKDFWETRGGAAIKTELCGASGRDVWFVLYCTEDRAVADRAFSGIYTFEPLKRLGLSQAQLYAIPKPAVASNVDADTCLGGVAALRALADVLGMPFFSSLRMDELQKRFDCQGLAALLPAVARRLPRSFALIFASVKPSVTLEPEEFSCSEIHRSETGSAVLFLKKIPFKAQAEFDILSWAEEVQEKLAARSTESDIPLMPLGACASYQPTVGRRGAIGAAFWAYVHASMLGKGDAILFDHVTWQVRGDKLLSSGAISEACRAYRNALALQHENVEILNSLGVALVEAGRRREAESCFERAASLDPDDFISFYNLCGIQHTLCKFEDAEAACLRAVELRPDDISALTRLGHLLLDAGKYEDAVLYLTKACTMAKLPLPALHRLLGIAEYRIGRWKEAKANLEKCLKLNAADIPALAWLALGYAEYEDDLATALRLAARLPENSSQNDINTVLSRLSAIIAESSLDKEKAGG